MNQLVGVAVAVLLTFGVSLAFAEPGPSEETPSADMVQVPEGEFLMGSDALDSSDDEKPVRRVHLDAYSIDRTEVTVAAYALCVDAGKCTAPDTTGANCSGSYAEYNNWVNDRRDHPVNCVDWKQAHAYCEWAGKRLPTEAEWEKAARGENGQTYPWGDDGANCSNTSMIGCPDGTAVADAYPSGASPYGAQQMAGNVWEWTADWLGSYDASQTRNPRGPSEGTKRATRGGGFNGYPVDLQKAAVGSGLHNYQPPGLRTTDRFGAKPSLTSGDLGFRCARSSD